MTNQQIPEPKAEYLFEICWEICNQIGGIHTVLKTKVPQMKDYYGNSYCVIGPYFPEQVKGEFKEKKPSDEFKQAFKKLEAEGIKCHFGEWLVKGSPKTILLDFSEYWNKLDSIKDDLWKNFEIDSLKAGHEFDEAVVWSRAAGKLIEELLPVFSDTKTVFQFHEWLSGGGLLYLKQQELAAPTVFTTHATHLGRTIADNQEELYSRIEEINPEEEAYKYGIEAKYLMEKQTAQKSDIFTTVSKITNIEAKYLLDREADVILPNGLSLDKFATFEEMTLKHRINRSRIRRFIMYYFFPYYTFDIEETYYYFIASRYEFHNKGIDTFIKSLGELNKKMKEEGSSKTIVTFFWVPSDIRGIKSEIIESRELFKNIENAVEDSLKKVEERILQKLMSGETTSEDNILPTELVEETKDTLLQLKRDGTPPLVTHNLGGNENNDPILQEFHKAGLENKKEDPVKVIFYPLYLDGSDGLLNLDYHECIQGSHLGVFPSFYEPWGYTPLETAALGVVSTTTDVAGFGRFISEETEKENAKGIFILDRMNRTEDKIVHSLTDILYQFKEFSHKERVQNKIRAREIAALADWKNLAKKYIEAQNKAVEG